MEPGLGIDELRLFSACLRTLPSSTMRTLSCAAICATSRFSPLNWNDEVRAATLSSGTRASTLRISSEIPSEKYSCSLSELRLTKGRTAMDGVVATASAAGAGCAGFRTKKYQMVPGAAANTPMARSMSPSRTFLGPAANGAVRSIFPSLMSKAQASMTATGKPSASATTV